MTEHFSDEQAKTILARAIELDSRAPTTTADDLRAIASDLGVTPSSLEAALREQTTAVATRRVIASRRAATAVAGLGLPLGLAVGSSLTSGFSYFGLVPLAVMGVGLIASGALVVVQGTAGTLRSFHLRNLALWGGVAAGSLASIALFSGGDARMAILLTAGWCVRSLVASSILGSAAVIAVKRAQRSDRSEADPDITDASATTAGRRWARVARQVVGWLTRTLRRERKQMALRNHEFNIA